MGTLPAEPPPGTGKKTLADPCQANGLSVSAVSRALAAEGLEVDPELTPKEIGAMKGIVPMGVYATIRQAVTQGLVPKP